MFGFITSCFYTEFHTTLVSVENFFIINFLNEILKFLSFIELLSGASLLERNYMKWGSTRLCLNASKVFCLFSRNCVALNPYIEFWKVLCAIEESYIACYWKLEQILLQWLYSVGSMDAQLNKLNLTSKHNGNTEAHPSYTIDLCCLTLTPVNDNITSPYENNRIWL